MTVRGPNDKRRALPPKEESNANDEQKNEDFEQLVEVEPETEIEEPLEVDDNGGN